MVLTPSLENFPSSRVSAPPLAVLQDRVVTCGVLAFETAWRLAQHDVCVHGIVLINCPILTIMLSIALSLDIQFSEYVT